MKARSAEMPPLRGFAFSIPGDLALATGGYAYDRRILAECRRSGCAASHVELPGSFPNPTAPDLAATAARLGAVPADLPLLIDGLALGALPAPLLAGLGRPVAALIHHPLALEAGLEPRRQMILAESERAALGFAPVVIATSASTARVLEQGYGVPPERLVVAVPGTDPRPRARGTAARGPGAPVRLVSVGAVIPRKAHGVLVEALARLKELDWTCVIVGDTTRDAAETARLRRRIVSLGLEERITLAGAVSDTELAEAYDAADLFVSASLFEGYGMALTEAIAHGLPVVACRAGAIPETVPPDTSVLVPPDDPLRLAEGIGTLLREPARRREMGRHAWEHAAALPDWPATAAAVMTALKELEP